MRYARISTIGALLVAAASVAGCNSDTAPVEDTSVSEEAARVAAREAELQREHEEDIANLSDRVAQLEREYREEAGERPRGTSGTSARRLHEEVQEDVANAREAVNELQTTSAANWWERHEHALSRTADDIEEDVRRLAGRSYEPAPRPEPSPAPTADNGDVAPFTSSRDRFVSNLRTRVDVMKDALASVNAKGNRQTELEDTRARIDKLADDLDRLKSAVPNDWWDISKKRVTEYIDRVEGSVARLEDVQGR